MNYPYIYRGFIIIQNGIPKDGKECLPYHEEIVLYNVGHHGLLSKILPHRLVYHKNSKIVILYSIEDSEAMEFMSRWNESNSDIGTVFTYPYSIFYGIQDSSAVENKLLSFFDNLFEKAGIPIEVFDKIYSGFDWNNIFCAYVQMKGKKYTLFDIGNNTLTSDWLYSKADNDYYKSGSWAVQKKYRTLSADSSGVSSVIWDGKSPKDIGKNDIVIDYVEFLNELTREEKNRLTSIFINNHVESGQYTLVLMRSKWPLLKSKIKKYDYTLSYKQRLLYAYRLLIDYCCDPSEKVLLKSHPHTELSRLIDETVPDVYSISGYFPSEFFTILAGVKVSKILNSGSSSINNLEYPEDALDFPQIYLDYYSEMNLLNTALDISKYIYGMNPNVCCSLEGWHDKLHALLKYMDKTINFIENKEFYDIDVMKIIGDSPTVAEDHVNFKRGESCSCIVLISPTISSAIKFKYESTIIKIEKTQVLDGAINYIGDLDPEYLMIISNNTRLIDKVNRYNREKKMFRCGVTLNCSPIDLKTFVCDMQMYSGSNLLYVAKMGNIETRKYLIRWCDLINNPGSNSEEYIRNMNYLGESLTDSISTFAESGDEASMAHMGRAYRDGKGVEKDLIKAADWMRKAVDKNPTWKNELFDILWTIGTPESHKEMISISMEYVESGDGAIMARLGRAYRDGKGVEKDLDKAAEWMRKAMDKGVLWAKKELSQISHEKS